MGELLSILSVEIINKYEGYYNEVYSRSNCNNDIGGAKLEVFDDVLSHNNYR